MTYKKKLSIIIPTFNEKDSIHDIITVTISFLDANNVPSEVLVIDDNSIDETPTIVQELVHADPRIKLFFRTTEKGMGSALFFGFQKATGDILIPVMADGSDTTKDILMLYKKMCEKDYDIIFTNRFSSQETQSDYPFLKKICNRTLNKLVALLYHYPYTDITNAFKAYSKKSIQNIAPTSFGFEALLEMPLQCLLQGGTFTEVPVHWYERRSGTSKLRLFSAGFRYCGIMCKYLPQRYFNLRKKKQ